MRVRLEMALVWSKTGAYPKAAETIAAVQKEATEIDDRQLVVSATVRFADYSRSVGEHPRALENYRAWLNITRAGGIVEDECKAGTAVARSLINLGRFGEARHTLAGLASDSRCSQPHQVTARAFAEGLLLTEEARFPEALAHYRAMRALARANQQTQIERNLRGFICIASILGEPLARSRIECGDLYRNPADSREAAAFQYAAADRFLHEGNWSEARTRAEAAVQANLQRGNLDDALYSTLIRGQAEARQSDLRQLAVTQADLKSLQEQLTRRWGEATVKQYLTRPLYASRWKEIATALAGRQ
jgi:tetratricopeptide (TPR) repeat protein